jgi:AsmA-like protein
MKLTKKLIKYFTYLFIASVVLAATSLYGFVNFVINEPKSFDFLTRYVEDRLNKLDQNKEFRLDKVIIQYNGDSQLRLVLSKLEVKDEHNKLTATIGEIDTDINLEKLFSTENIFQKIAISDSDISYEINDADIIPDNSNENTIPEAGDFENIVTNIFSTKMNIFNVSVNLNTKNTRLRWDINKAFGRREGKNFIIAFDSMLNNKKALFYLVAGVDGKDIKLDAEFENLPVTHIASVFENLPYTEPLSNKTNVISIDGKIKLDFNLNKKLKYFLLSVDAIHGRHYIDLKNGTYINFKDINVKMDYIETTKLLDIKKLDILMENDIGFGLNGKIDLSKKTTKINADISNLPVDLLGSFWPNKYLYNTRDWILNNVNSGEITKAVAKINLTPRTFKDGELPPEALSINIDVKDTNLTFYKKFSKITNIDGSVNIDGEKVIIILNKGKFINSHLTDTKANISFAGEDKLIEVEASLMGPLVDLGSFISPEQKQKLKGFDIDFAKIQGTADTKINVVVPIKAPGDLLVNTSSTLRRIRFNTKFDRFPLAQTQLFTQIKDNGLKLNLKGRLSDIAFKLGIVKDFDSDILPEIGVLFNLSNDNIKKLRLPIDITLKQGTLPVRLSLKGSNLIAKADLTKVGMSLQQIGFNTEVGQKVAAVLHTNLKNGNIAGIDKITIKGDGVWINGSIKFIDGTTKLSSLDFTKILYGKNDFRLKYNLTHDGFAAELQGKSLDFASMKLSTSNKDDAHKDANKAKTNKEIKINLDNVFMKNDQQFNNLRAGMNCIDVFNCSYGYLETDLGEGKTFKVSLQGSEEAATILSVSDNAAAVLKGFGLYKNINDGILRLNATKITDNSGDGKAIPKFIGSFEIEDFDASQKSFLVQILQNILLLQDPTGLFSGKGFKMKDFKVDLEFYDGKLYLTNGKILGNKFYITIAGVIDTRASRINLTGNFVPSVYGLNKAIRNIPLIGPLVTGGKDNSVVSAKYKIKGNFDDAKVSVNPLSIIPIGFLKNIFE